VCFFFVWVLCLVCPILQVSLDSPFVIFPSGFSNTKWGNLEILTCYFVFVLCLVCPILQVSLDSPFLIVPSSFSNAKWGNTEIWTWYFVCWTAQSLYYEIWLVYKRIDGTFVSQQKGQCYITAVSLTSCGHPNLVPSQLTRCLLLYIRSI
jgi:hypothetical protein